MLLIDRRKHFHNFKSLKLYTVENEYFFYHIDILQSYLTVALLKKMTLTHDSYFTYFYPRVHFIITNAVWCISLWSCIDVGNPLSKIVYGDVHYRRWTSRLGIVVVHQMFGIRQRMKNLRYVCVNGKSCWSLVCLKG